jgi:hypothetical protein
MAMLNRRIALIFSLFLLSKFSLSQNNFNLTTGTQLTILAQFGSHQKSYGIRLNCFLQYAYLQFNAGSTLSYYPFSLGKRKSFFESKNSFGLVCFFGKQNQYVNWQLNPLVKQSKHDYAVSYSSIWYRDNAGTSQRSGAFGLQIKRFTISHENDAFAGIATDRFRTGILKVHWNDSIFKLGGGLFIWTGETTGVPKQLKSELYPKYFKDVSTLPYGKTSHGIAYVEADFLYFSNQNIGFQLGTDSENIRHFVQNKFLHDLPFLPKRFQHQTPHYPRLSEDGHPVFRKDEVRKNKIYYSLGFNDY